MQSGWRRAEPDNGHKATKDTANAIKIVSFVALSGTKGREATTAGTIYFGTHKERTAKCKGWIYLVPAMLGGAGSLLLGGKDRNPPFVHQPREPLRWTVLTVRFCGHEGGKHSFIQPRQQCLFLAAISETAIIGAGRIIANAMALRFGVAISTATN